MFSVVWKQAPGWQSSSPRQCVGSMIRFSKFFPFLKTICQKCLLCPQLQGRKGRKGDDFACCFLLYCQKHAPATSLFVCVNWWWPLDPQKRDLPVPGWRIGSPHPPWTMHLWVARSCLRENISGTAQSSETTLIFPLLLISNDTWKTIIMWGTTLPPTFPLFSQSTKKRVMPTASAEENKKRY